jgi:hypothetical protein
VPSEEGVDEQVEDGDEDLYQEKMGDFGQLPVQGRADERVVPNAKRTMSEIGLMLLMISLGTWFSSMTAACEVKLPVIWL